MKRLLYIGLTVAASLTAFAADPPDDAEAVQGSWIPPWFHTECRWPAASDVDR